MIHPQLSVVVPLFFPRPHEARVCTTLRTFFAQLAAQSYPDFELFLSDSGPEEHHDVVRHTVDDLLREFPSLSTKVRYHYEITGAQPLSRAEAMNLGVQRTQGEGLLFLHIDCKLPFDGLYRVNEAFSRGALGGGFLKVYVGKKWLSPLLLTEQYLNWMRTMLDRQLVGTNAMFLTRALASNHPYVGGFLEDVEMSDWMKRMIPPSQWKLILSPVEVSAKEYDKYGAWPSIAINASVMGLYRLFDVDPLLLKSQLYHRSFPGGWAFWKTLTSTVVKLIDQSLRQREHKDD